uniref:PRMT5_TIM domain-containing protein n=1 Tax=Globodera pallida TaxID=36090 RepID=A0A183CC94_GLOPA
MSSDNTSNEEQQQQMKEIFICADIWLEVFAFLSPFEVGLKVALISDRLDVLVDVHFKSRKWSLGWMEILCTTDGHGAQIAKHSGERMPIPQGPIPKKVIGFEWIEISYVDQTVIEFLQRICRLLESSGANVTIGTPGDQSRSWEMIWQKIWPLLKDNIYGFLLTFFQFNRLRQFSPTILRNCAKLRFIASIWAVLLEFPPAGEDCADASSAQALAKWLLTPRGDGLPKMSFVIASEPVNFIICLCGYFSAIEPFELTNNWTEERLALRQMDEINWLLVRCPIVREEDKWAKWEKEAIEWNWGHPQWNCIEISFKDRDIGDGVLDAKFQVQMSPTSE